jgi:hypothetical protein
LRVSGCAPKSDPRNSCCNTTAALVPPLAARDVMDPVRIQGAVRMQPAHWIYIAVTGLISVTALMALIGGFYFFTLVYDPLIKSDAEMADSALPKKN